MDFLMDFLIYDGILNIKLLHFELSKSGQILCIHKTSFPRLSHI